MRKLLSVILALVMVLSVFTPVFAEEAPKATEAPEAAPAAAPMAKHIDFLKEQGIIQGDKSGSLMLDQNIDRASFAAILVRAAGKEATAESVKTIAPRFKDLTVAHWANGYATVALESNLMKGNPAGEFMPGKQISYAEIATTLVRFLGKEKAGFVYPTSYIAAATELGLFNGVEIGGAFTANATRDNVFKMLYNAVSKEDFGRYNVYKMIVLENSRVANIGDDNIKAEVLSVVQVANNVSERNKVAKVGQQFVLNVKGVKAEGVLADAENLLGKVANFTVDQNGKLVKIELDNSYKYITGRITGFDSKSFGIDWDDYAVRVDERYYRFDNRREDRDDRMYRTYLTTEDGVINYSYLDFVKARDDEKIAPNFARMTVKDGMVLFVDAYRFNDIAPIKEVARDGKEVSYYNDARNGAVDRIMMPAVVVGYTADKGFYNLERNMIKADDVIHWFDGFYLVRQDATRVGNLVKTLLNARGEFVVVQPADKEAKAWTINSGTDKYTVSPYKAVYAFKDKVFRRLDSRAQLQNAVGADVKVLVDVLGRAQLITSDMALVDSIALVDRVVSSKGMQFFAPNGAKQYRLADDWDSNYWYGDWNNSSSFRYDNFKDFDLVYVGAKDDNIRVVAKMVEHKDYSGLYEPATFEKRSNRYITIGGRNYRYGDDTDVFVVNYRDKYDANGRVIGKAPYFVRANMADVIERNKDNANLKAFPYTEAAFKAFLARRDILDINTFSRYNKTGYLRAVIFTNAYDTLLAKDMEVAKLISVDNYSNSVTIQTREGAEFETLKISPRSNINFKADLGEVYNDAGHIQERYMGLGDWKLPKFVRFQRVEKGEEEAEVKSAVFDSYVKMTCVAITNKLDDSMVVENDGVRRTLYIDNKYSKEFGNSRDDWAYVAFDKEGYIEVIQYANLKRLGGCPVLRTEQTLDANTEKLVKAFDQLVDALKVNPSEAELETLATFYVSNIAGNTAAEKAAEVSLIKLNVKWIGTEADYKENKQLVTEALTLGYANTLAETWGLPKEVKNGVVPADVAPLKKDVQADIEGVKAMTAAQRLRFYLDMASGPAASLKTLLSTHKVNNLTMIKASINVYDEINAELKAYQNKLSNEIVLKNYFDAKKEQARNLVKAFEEACEANEIAYIGTPSYTAITKAQTVLNAYVPTLADGADTTLALAKLAVDTKYNAVVSAVDAAKVALKVVDKPAIR